MELYERMKNIYGKNNEEELVRSIGVVKEKLNGLVAERMCKVYSGFLLDELNNRHVPARLINTCDLGLDYEHEFVLVPSNNEGYFLADLTFSQFNVDDEKLNKLLESGYQFVSDVDLNHYFTVINKSNDLYQFFVDDVFYQNHSFNSDMKK